MLFENTQVFNFEGALRGMRNPKESWDKSDSDYCLNIDFIDCSECPTKNNCPANKMDFAYIVGKNDMKLAQALIKAGSEHRKFLRQIFVSVDITAPLYWWKEFDTYKVGTVANSTSTMHKMASKPITLDCFEIDDYDENLGNYFDCACNVEGRDGGYLAEDVQFIIDLLENLRQTYLETKDKKYWKELIRWLPESWLQTRTVTMTYENLFAMCSKGQRRFHKLNEWSGQDKPNVPNFISWARTLPYAQEFIFIDEVAE